MPKEVVYGDHLPFGEDDPGVSIVEVRWSRESGDVQVATKAVSRIDHGPLVETGPGDGIHYTAGFHVQLGRSGINDLIRYLRRARDQAFGRDE
jgi:hypothetical protein